MRTKVEHRASEAILRRVLAADTQIEIAANRGDKAALERVQAVRTAYVVDLVDVLSDESAQVSRRANDKFEPYSVPKVEAWIKSRKRHLRAS